MGGVSANRSADAQPIAALKARVAAERAGRPFLLYVDGDGRQQLFVLEPGCSRVSVGRDGSSDLRLDWDDQVSRVHARFERVADDWELVDDGPSRNGTFVDGERLSGRRRLSDGDTLRFGATTITFRAPAPGQPDAAGAPGTPVAPGLSTTQRRVLVALCRPYKDGAGPATDEQIAEELFLPVGAVRTHLRVLCAKLGVAEQPQDAMRVRLVERAVCADLITERDL